MRQVPYIFFVMKSVIQFLSVLALCLLTLTAQADSVQLSPANPEPLDSPKKRFFKEPGEPGTIEYAFREDQQCLLEQVYAPGPRGRFQWPSKEELRTWTDHCITFDTGIGSYILVSRSKPGKPYEPQSEQAQRALEGFKGSARVWVYAAVRRCQRQLIQSASACRAFIDELVLKQKAESTELAPDLHKVIE